MRMSLRKRKVIFIVLSPQALAKLQILSLTFTSHQYRAEDYMLITALLISASVFLLHQGFYEECRH